MALSLDQETEVELQYLDILQDNPKKRIHGVYREGLKGSIQYLGLDDRLKVWPRADMPGRFIIINGNQRFDVYTEILRDKLVRSRFQLPDDAKSYLVKRIIDDPANTDQMKEINSEILRTKIPVQIKTRLNEETKFTMQHAKIYAAIYDRNHASYDEGKQALIAREIAHSKDMSEGMISLIMRPEKALVSPIAPISPVSPSKPPPTVEVEAKPSLEVDPELINSPWGDIPEDIKQTANEKENKSQSDEASQRSGPAPQLIPAVFSFTPNGHKEIFESILKLKSRIFRETRLKSALEKLEKISDVAVDKLDDAVVEIALRTLSVHIEVAEADEDE